MALDEILMVKMGVKDHQWCGGHHSVSHPPGYRAKLGGSIKSYQTAHH
jgi:hypothetical protein